MSRQASLQHVISRALPIMAGYVAIGIPCGILEDQIGLAPWMAFVTSATFYSGAGQFMICNLWMAGVPAASVIASVALVSSRQMLYSAAFAPRFATVRKRLTALFSATVTDESFGVNLAAFENDDSWNAAQATGVNICSLLSWSVANAVGCVVGNLLTVPVAIASFAMTSIFICLLMCQRLDAATAVVVVASVAGVILCKLAGGTGAAILVGAVLGVAAGLVWEWVRGR